MMQCHILTLFPEMLSPVLGQSILKRAQEKHLLEVWIHNVRDYTGDRHKTADDTPYGGGAGMVLKAEPIFQAVEALRGCLQQGEMSDEVRLILPSPQGRLFTQDCAKNLAHEGRPSVFICGHYEGIDERVKQALHPEEISLGDYVLTGGELAALVMLDASIRLIPGVLGDPASTTEETFSDSLLEYPHYTRPADVRGMTVPDVLISGHHGAIRLWRRKESLRNTYLKRPDLLRDRVLSEEDQTLLNEIVHESLSAISVQDREEG